MVDKLKRFGVITSDSVEDAFRGVDRKFFVPRGHESMAWADQPLKEGNVHISAPHIYGSAMQALDLRPNSSTSFLNIGSGTGYISCIAAHILGPNSLNYSVELHDDVIEHCKTSVARWKASTVEVKDGNSTIHFMDDKIADIQIVKGNGLNILRTKGEGVVGFDRIYIGAAVDKEDLDNITKLLSPGGILVGPIDDELVKVVRVGKISLELEEDETMRDDDSSFAGLNEEFTSQILSGVRFAPLVHVSGSTVIPANVWKPSIQRGYPSEFKHASMQLLMCSNSQLIQPLPPVPSQDERCNIAAMLPQSIWFNILSYTHRKWFEPEQSETDYLKRRLREEKAKVAKAEKARRDAEERCREAEKERAVYRLLARRWQSRLDAVLSQQEEQANEDTQQQDAAIADLLDLAGGSRIHNLSRLSNLREVVQQLNGDVNDEAQDGDDSEDEGAELGVEDMNMEVEGGGEDLLDFFEDDGGENDSDSDDFASVVAEDQVEDDGSVVMEDVNSSPVVKGRAADQPRTVSLSSDTSL